jgi:hypothetical protein
MSPIVIIDKVGMQYYSNATKQEMEYRQPDDKQSFWTGKFPTTGKVHGFMCGDCGRIALYGRAPDA